MAMASDEEDEQPRLYSKGFRMRTPVDEVAPQHEALHGLLIRWGRWVSQRGKNSSLPSLPLYSGTGGTPASTAPMAADLQLVAVERAVLRMPMQHADTVRMLYVRRLTANSICQALRMRYEAWPDWAFSCRAMVRNLLRREGLIVGTVGSNDVSKPAVHVRKDGSIKYGDEGPDDATGGG